MARPFVLACAVLACAPLAHADSPAPPALAAALAEARDHLKANRPADAVETLERHLTTADGNREFRDLLRDAYAAELARLQSTAADPRRVADLRTKLTLLGPAPVSEQPAPPPPPVVPQAEPKPTGPDPLETLQKAALLFQEAKAELTARPKDEPRKFGLAARLFAAAFANRTEMTQDQLAAWAYCRVRLAADSLNHNGDPTAVAAEVEDALKLAPSNAGLQKVGADLIAAARQRGAKAVPASAPLADGWDVVETPSFRVKYTGRRAVAEAVAKAAEAKREAIFAKWSGPPGGAWGPKCEVTLHPTADAFGRATNQPAAGTGRAVVQLTDGRPVERRIDLRADDPTLADDALPRELTTVVLADLFWEKAPPRWAEVGMAVLAESPAEVERYRRTLAKCADRGELPSVAAILEAAAPPADRATGYAVGSVSLVEFLVRWKGEKAFTTFVRDAQRYGLASALKRQYGVSDARELEAAWKRGGLTAARGQAP